MIILYLAGPFPHPIGTVVTVRADEHPIALIVDNYLVQEAIGRPTQRAGLLPFLDSTARYGIWKGCHERTSVLLGTPRGSYSVLAVVVGAAAAFGTILIRLTF